MDKNMIIKKASKRMNLPQKPISPDMVKWDLEYNFQILKLSFIVCVIISLGLSFHTSNMEILPTIKCCHDVQIKLSMW